MAPSTMILLDSDLDPEPPHGRRPIRGGPEPAPKKISARRLGASGAAAKLKTNPRDFRLPSARTLARFLETAQGAVRLKGQVTVLLTTDAAIAKLNKQFRGKNKATDVLSFPTEGPLRGSGAEAVAGDLAISVTTALKQAREQGHSLSTEIKVLMLHGVLHLAGYDHEADSGQMARRELVLRAKLKLPQGLIERVEAPSRRDVKQQASGAKAPTKASALEPGLKSRPTVSAGAKARTARVGVLRELNPPPPSVKIFTAGSEARKSKSRSAKMGNRL